MFEVSFLGKKQTFDKKIRLGDLLTNKEKDKYYVAKVNNALRELNYEFAYNAKVEFLTAADYDVSRVYEASLRYLISMAAFELDPTMQLSFDYSVSRALYCEIRKSEKKVDTAFLEALQKKVLQLVKQDYPIKRITVTKDKALAIYDQFHFYDKVEVLKYRENDFVHLYECNGYYNYMYSLMVNRTGVLNKFKFRLYNPGFIIQFPRSESEGLIPEFVDDVQFGRTLREEKSWIQIVGAETIAEINAYKKERRLSDFVNMCETRHSNMIAELGVIIKSQMENLRLICVAGPSSSGKTTFTNRLRIELLTRGIKPFLVSIDDYYKPKAEAPKDEFGQPDLEHLHALDVELFNSDLQKLISGEEVSLPRFDFKLGKRSFRTPVKVSEEMPILIEGIHALNEELTSYIPHHQKYKIYISPHPQYHIDYHNPISITDIRLLRRIVRDKEYRNTVPADTLRMWPSVRRGEFKWIYPNQETSDYVFNSELTYEIGILKKYALEALEAISRDHEFYITANRLVKFLRYFEDIDDKFVPANSLLKEFIGGSSFYYD
ncbi:MAG: hypothetical protein FWE36_03915 [Erysipelotrichales bacterium]|nr:hypothetical protein [Erysipelotrichales bacterium]